MEIYTRASTKTIMCDHCYQEVDFCVQFEKLGYEENEVFRICKDCLELALKQLDSPRWVEVL